MATCKKCFAEIKWITTAAGRYLPVDPGEVSGVDLKEIDTLITPDGEILKGKNAVEGFGYIPHWATCPNAEEFKKDRNPNLRRGPVIGS